MDDDDTGGKCAIIPENMGCEDTKTDRKSIDGREKENNVADQADYSRRLDISLGHGSTSAPSLQISYISNHRAGSKPGSKSNTIAVDVDIAACRGNEPEERRQRRVASFSSSPLQDDSISKNQSRHRHLPPSGTGAEGRHQAMGDDRGAH